MDPQTQATEDADAIWPTISTTISSARTAARSITLDTQRAGADGRFLSLESRFDSVGTRLLDLEKKALEGRATEGVADELVAQFLDLRATVSDTASRFDSLVAKVAASNDERSTSLLQTVDAFDTRIVGVEDTRLQQGEELREMMSYLERAFASVDDLSGRLDNGTADTTAGLEDLRSLITHLDTKLLETIGEKDAASALIELRATEGTDQIATVRSRADQLDRRADEVLTRTEQLDSRIDSALARSDQLDQRIDGTLTRNEQIDTRLGEAITKSDQLVADASERGDQLDERISGISTHADATDVRIEEVNSRLDQLNSRIDHAANTATEAGAQVHERIDALAESMHEERTELGGQLDNLAHDSSQAASRIDSLESRLTEAEQQGADRIAEAREQLANRLQTTERHLNDRSDEIWVALDERSSGIDSRVEAINSRVDATEREAGESADRLTQLLSHAQSATAESLQEAEETINRRIDESATQVAYGADQALTEIDERLNRVEGSVSDRIGELKTGTEQRLSSIDDRTTSQIRDIETQILEQVAHTGNSLDQRLAQVETTVSEDRTAEFTTAVESAENEAKKAQDLSESLRVLQTDLVRALEHELSGHAERLGTIEVEFASAQSDRQEFVEIRQSLANADARIEHSEATIASLASRDQGGLGESAVDNSRLELLESRFYEAAQVIEKLSEFQQHNASVDSVNHSLASMAGGVDRAAVEVESLREQLDLALNRIDQLEESGGSRPEASATNGEPFTENDNDASAFEQSPNQMFNRPGDQSRGEDEDEVAEEVELVERSAASQAASKELDSLYGLSPDHQAEADRQAAEAEGEPDADSGWFAESYAKKSKQKGRFRRG